MGNFAMVVAGVVGLTLKKMFLGSGGYEDIEAVLTDHLKSTLIDTLLMLTIFREEINSRFIVLFVSLLFAKTFHWLADMKVEKV
jgi:E3 ubiquitin-protein ligase synoviolin